MDYVQTKDKAKLIILLARNTARVIKPQPRESPTSLMNCQKADSWV